MALALLIVRCHSGLTQTLVAEIDYPFSGCWQGSYLADGDDTEINRRLALQVLWRDFLPWEADILNVIHLARRARGSKAQDCDILAEEFDIGSRPVKELVQDWKNPKETSLLNRTNNCQVCRCELSVQLCLRLRLDLGATLNCPVAIVYPV